MKTRTLINYLFLFGLIANLVVSEVWLFGKFIYPSYVISVLMLIAWLASIIKSSEYIKVNTVIIFPLLIITSIFLSYSYTVIFLPIETTFSFLARELLLYVPMLPFFLLLSYINPTEKQIEYVVLFTFFIFIIVGILQALGYERAVSIYANASHIDIALNGSRIVITGSDPNTGALIASFYLMFYISKFFYSKSYISLILSLIALSFIFLTQSRTTIIGSGVVIFIYTLIMLKTNVVYKIIITIFLLGLVFYLQSFFNLSYVTVGIDMLKEGQNNSVNVRLENTNYALENFYTSPIFGWGSSLEQLGTVRYLDSEVAVIFQRYGIFGFTIILTTILAILYTGFKNRETRLGIFMLLIMCSLIFNMMTNAVFFGVQSVSIIMFLLFLKSFLRFKYQNRITKLQRAIT